jgi:hypothetical protein
MPSILKINKPRTTPVSLARTPHALTNDVALWAVIRNSCTNLSFKNYTRFIDDVMCAGTFNEIREARAGAPPDDDGDVDSPNDLGDSRFDNRVLDRYEHVTQQKARERPLPFTGADRYALLKAATEVYVMAMCGVNLDHTEFTRIIHSVRRDQELVGTGLDLNQITAQMWDAYLDHIKVEKGAPYRTLPYYGLILQKLRDVTIDTDKEHRLLTSSCADILQKKLTRPCFMELIWSYWHEEGMLVQTMQAIMLRFQNATTQARDPLAHMEIDPLRPLNNLLWGLIQDEIHRLSVNRRAYEYQHEYGLSLLGKAIQSNFRPVESRSKFIEAFHNLLYLCSVFYKEDDDTTVVADGFPVLNAIKEVHILLAEGAHNQYGDLPSTARQEMMAQQWILARPEFRDFLPTRIMVAYEEPWMDRVEAMKKIQGWTDTSVYHFRDLAFFGEQILLSARFGGWPTAFNAENGANWARFWRSEIQGYVHAYRAVTGVDLTAEVTTPEQGRARFLQPSLLLRNRLTQQLQEMRAGAGALPAAMKTSPVLANSPALLNLKGRV